MNKLLTPQEMADMLGVQKSTIYQWTHQGFIPYVKLGNLVRFRESAVNKWIEKREIKGKRSRKIDIREIEIKYQPVNYK
ncbi:MAG: helix-turn-helix domain-containing protein [PVC group bacterium]|nr:helix-turn-helix domain-containing protein [PVC group bacterium]